MKKMIRGTYGFAKFVDGIWKVTNRTYPLAIFCASEADARWTLRQDYREPKRDYV
jgi:hypothetical protein